MKHTFHVALIFGTLILSGCRSQSAPMDKVRTANASTRNTRKVTSGNANKITRASFKSLQLATVGGYIYQESRLSISDKKVQLNPNRQGEKKPLRQARLSSTELDSLIKVLNDARFIQIAGDYENHGAADAISRTLTLSLRQPGKTQGQSYTVSDNIDKAPKSFYKVLGWLDTLQNRKFPSSRRR